MSGWWASRRRLQAENDYLQLKLAQAQARPPLVVKPGPPPTAAETTTAPAVEELLRGELRLLRQLKTPAGARELMAEARRWRGQAQALDERLLLAQTANESLTRELAALRAVSSLPIPKQGQQGAG